MTDPIRVLHVDDDRDFAELTATFLERESDHITVETATTAPEGLDRLAEGVDCVVSDYDMAESTGIGFLEAVREEYPDLPFILFTGKGSEAVASDAISAGVTDYLQKKSGTDQYELLANRITNAVAQYRAERELEVTERRYRRLIEESTDVITVVDEDGLFQYVSPAAKRVFGYEPETLIGSNGFELMHPDDRPAATEAFADLLERPEAHVTHEFRFEHAEAGWIWLEVKGRNLLADPAIGGIVVHARDVTQRKERERERERERDRIAAAFDAAPYPLVHVRFEEDTAIVLRANDAFAETFGFDPDTVTGTSLDAHIVPDDAPAAPGDINERTRAGERVETEIVRATAEGERREFLFKSAPVTGEHGRTEGIGTYVDITERKEREQALREARERMEFALDATDSIIYEVDLETRAETHHGPYERLFGIDPEAIETSADAFDTIVHPEDRDRVARLQELGTLRELDWELDYDFRTHPDRGPVRWIHSQAYVRLTPEGDPQELIGLSTDLTDRKERERQLARFETIIEAIDDAAFVIDADRTVAYANEASLRNVNTSREAVYGRPIVSLVETYAAEAADADRFERSLERAFDAARPRAFSERVEIPLEIDGKRAVFEYQFSPIVEDGVTDAVVVTSRDVTERATREQTLKTLHTAATEIQGCETVEAACARAVEAAEEILNFEMCSVFLHEDGVLEPVAVSSESPPEGARPMDVEEGLAGKTFRTRESYLIDDIAEASDAAPAKGAYRSGLSVPLGEVGVFQAVATVPAAFDDSDLALAELLMAHTARTIERIQFARDGRDDREATR